MTTPSDRRYSASHEWHQVQGDHVVIGLTRYAVDALTDVTYVELRKAGTHVAAGDSVGEVESVKTTSDVYSAVEGEIASTNDALESNPGLLNDNPYEHWLVRLRVSDLTPLDGLMDAATYDAHHAG
jgi:glycine cleavage system H protein